jgi:hypothetical protein
VGVFTVHSEGNQALGAAYSFSYVACFGAYGLLNTDPDYGSGVFQRNSRTRFADIRDGMSNTIAVGERAAMFAKAPWCGVLTDGTVRTTPGAPVFTATTELAPVMALCRVGNRALNDGYSEPYDFYSPHAGVAMFMMMDGSVRSIAHSINLQTLRHLATRANDDDVSGAF